MDLSDIDLDEVASAFHVENSTGKRCKATVMQDISTKRARKKLPKFQTFNFDSGEGCFHEVVYPIDQPFKKLETTTEPARQYPFILDPFQQRAILCIENGQSVLVSAHTSAGKTVVAEYAVARCLKHKQRVIYTTPIKALSNQKFREFTEIFKDVGLMTGDITINPEATVLIMTTEILRSMLYRGSEVTREVGWVIFDEIHYMREKERGVVWEETIILLPDSVGLVFLSATIPNAHEFAEWIVLLHKKPCNVVYTDYRPVPLQHYVFPCGGDGIYLVVNQKREFLESNFNSALTILQNAAGNAASDTKMRGRKGGSIRSQPYCAQLVKLVMDQNLEPLIVFSFSKRDCEFYATQLTKMDFNTDTEKAAVDLIFNNAIESLSLEDRNLPQVQTILPVLRRGIGIHHGGLLPILKEIVEILFGEGLIKVLYATETFAMGLNMPARTVLFTATRKFDGRDFRLLSSGEYIQMSGRAGRRGKDTRGTVILLLDDRITSNEARQLLLGQPDRLNSAFYLTNNMILNLLRVDDINPEIMLEKSFYQFQNNSKLPSLEKRLNALESLTEEIQFTDDVDMGQLDAFVNLQNGLSALQRERWSIVTQAKKIIPFLQVGRIVRVQNIEDVDYGWGIVLHLRLPGRTQKVKSEIGITVECLLKTSPKSIEKSQHQDSNYVVERPIPLSLVEPAVSDIGETEDKNEFACTVQVISVPLSCLTDLSSVCLKMSSMVDFDCRDSERLSSKITKQPEHVRNRIWEGIDRARTKLNGELPCLDPIKDMNIRDDRVIKLSETIHMFKARMDLNPVSKRSDLNQLLEKYDFKSKKLLEIQQLRQRMENTESLLQLGDLNARKRLLRRLGFCSEDDAIALKGRIACEISSGDELMLTELLLDGFFSDMSPSQLAGVLSCFVSEQQSSKQSAVDLQPDMVKALKTIQTKARFLAQVASDCRILSLHSNNVDVDNSSAVPEAGALLSSRANPMDDEKTYINRFSGDLMEVVRAWAQGVSFARLCELTAVFEGSVIRCMRRLEELLRQMHDAAKVAGNSELENKFLEVMILIKRDIVFAASLYL